MNRRLRGVMWAALFPTLLFGSAGTLAWAEAWAFLVCVYFYVALLGRYVRVRDPTLLRELVSLDRTVPGSSSDQWFAWIYWPLFLIRLPVMGFDAIRFEWSQMPLLLQWLGVALVFGCFSLLFSVLRANTFFSPSLRIQTERQHAVIDYGPYRWVRHPMYLAMASLLLGSALWLGSWIGVAIGLVMVASLMLRSRREEALLVEQLHGYGAYQANVRFRMIPGLW